MANIVRTYIVLDLRIPYREWLSEYEDPGHVLLVCSTFVSSLEETFTNEDNDSEKA